MIQEFVMMVKGIELKTACRWVGWGDIASCSVVACGSQCPGARQRQEEWWRGLVVSHLDPFEGEGVRTCAS